MKNENHVNSYSHILKYTGLFGGIQLLTILVGLLKNKFVAILLGPAGMGLISLFNSTLTLVSSLTGLGLSTSSVKNLSEAFEEDKDGRLIQEATVVRTWCMLTAVLGTIVCAASCSILDSVTFSWGDHKLHFIALSPVIGMAAITSGELAVLKAIRRLRSLAAASLGGVLAVVAISIPIYYIWGASGIIPCLLMSALVQMVITVSYSYRSLPPRFSFTRDTFRRGLPMVRLGVAFIIAGVAASGSEFTIRSFLNNTGELATVGLYSAGYMIVMTYGNLIFTAMETDYYPRLSATSDREAFIGLANSQCEVSLLLISPMLTAFIIFVPFIIPLLFSGKFAAVTPMVQVALLALYIRSIKLPVAYMSLAKGDSLLFLAVEAFYAVAMCLSAMAGYTFYGLNGIGYAIVATGLAEYVVLLVATGRKYGYRMSASLKKYVLYTFPIGAVSYILSLTVCGAAYWLSGILLTAVSVAVSIVILLRKTALSERLHNILRIG